MRQIIFGDQLNQTISSLNDIQKNDLILLGEVNEEATHIKHHKKKIHPKGTIKPTPLLYRPWVVHMSNFNSSQGYKTDVTNKWKVNKKLS